MALESVDNFSVVKEMSGLRRFFNLNFQPRFSSSRRPVSCGDLAKQARCFRRYGTLRGADDEHLATYSILSRHKEVQVRRVRMSAFGTRGYQEPGRSG